MQLAILIACGLLLIGFALRARLAIFDRLFIPASVIAGFLGFALIQIGAHVPSISDRAIALGAEWRSWPAWLIAVVFGGMLLEKPQTSLRHSIRRAASAGIFAWIIIVGQIAIGYAIVWLLLRPIFTVPLPMGQLLEVSWAGGFGSSAAWGNVYDRIGGFPDARDLAIFFAACGLLYGTVSGIVLVNIAVRRRWTHPRAARSRAADARHAPAAFARARADMIDPLAFQACILAMAVAMGWLLSIGVTALAGWFDHIAHASITPAISQLPLFLYALIGGLIVREIMRAIGAGDLIDPLSIRRLVATAMEFLIVSALASMRLSSIVTYAIPSLMLMLASAIWCAVTLIWIARRLLPREYWFELAIINYGMATGTTAQGMMLLRMIDPDLDTPAAEDYALAAPLSAPFIGGGVITLALPTLLMHVHVGWIVLSAAVVIGALWVVGRRFARA